MPPPAVRVLPNSQYQSRVQSTQPVKKKRDSIVYESPVYKSPKDILYLIYVGHPRRFANPELLKLMKELRGGDWELVRDIAAITFMILIMTTVEGFGPFAPNPGPGWGLGRPDPFQPPGANHGCSSYDEFLGFP